MDDSREVYSKRCISKQVKKQKWTPSATKGERNHCVWRKACVPEVKVSSGALGFPPALADGFLEVTRAFPKGGTRCPQGRPAFPSSKI